MSNDNFRGWEERLAAEDAASLQRCRNDFHVNYVFVDGGFVPDRPHVVWSANEDDDDADADGLEAMSVKALKAIAEGKGVSLAGCVEKGDIIRAVRGPVRRDAESRDRQLLRLERTAEQRLESSWTAIAPPAACRVLRFRTFGDRGLVAVTFDAPATTTVADALRAYQRPSGNIVHWS